MFKDFYEIGRFVRGGGAEDFKDFRPTSLVCSLYKLIAKVLANRMKKIMGRLVSKAQKAFVKGRQILDAPLITNEVIDSMLRKGEKGILCKLDIKKAYDQINWSFVLTVLQKMGFGRRWIAWIKWYITTASFSVIINDNPTGYFRKLQGASSR